MNKVTDWWIFTKERFEPMSHLSMILVFLLVHIIMIYKILDIHHSISSLLFLLIGTTAFYFKLRLYDEVKDYELDIVINKDRPMPRGLLKHKDMYQGVIACILIEILCFASQGISSLVSILVTIGYSLLMFKEFFIKEKIRPHLTTYAVIHTVVTSFLSISIFSYLTQETFVSIINTPHFLAFSIANWMLFNIFEFGRKTYSADEERPNIDTYSSLFGKKGAVALVISQAIIAFLLILQIPAANKWLLYFGHSALIAFLSTTAFVFIFSNKVRLAKIYRLACSLYIIIFYLITALAYL